MKRTSLIILTTAVVLTSTVSRAQWQSSGTLVCGATAFQTNVLVASDGAGGAVMAWKDLRNGGVGSDVYAQRINGSGVAQWTLHGVAVCTLADDQIVTSIIGDGVGGAIVAWIDKRSGTNYDVYAQRITAAGAVQWTANGVPVCTVTADDNGAGLVPDGAGGAIVTWYDTRGATGADVYAQRINGAGALQWTANGVTVSAAAGDQLVPIPVADGAGGEFVVFWDHRGGVDYDVYAQRINSAGAAQWAVNGVALCALTGDQAVYGVVTDGAGGAITLWSDMRSGNVDLYAQRINSAGVPQWAGNGVALCTNTAGQYSPELVTDGAGGAIAAWYDSRNGADDIYAQKVNSAGVVLWAGDGVDVSNNASSQNNPQVAPDGAGGAMMVWYDLRNGPTELYGQRINTSGVVQWASAGVAFATNNIFRPSIVSDGSGGAIFAWEDYRFGPSDLYAQRVEGAYGYWGRPEPTVVSAKDVPKDQGGHVAVNWTASGHDVPSPPSIGYYSVWRAVDSAPFAGAGASASNALIPLVQVGPDTAHGARMAAAGYYWELVGTQTAYRWKSYSFSTETRADSVLGNAGNEVFMVAAHDVTDGHIAFASNAITGHSVDNLAPLAPLALTAQRIGNYVHLKWNRVHVPDLKDYSVYRKTSSGVTPIPVNFLASANDTVLTDTSPPASAIYYIVTAYDVHANQSAPSNEATVQPATGVGNLPPITALTVLQNHPNPFTGETELEIGLPASSDVNVEVFDVAGRKVSTITVKQAAAGWDKMAFSGRDSRGRPLASGVYFYRVHANGTTVTRKMVITR